MLFGSSSSKIFSTFYTTLTCEINNNAEVKIQTGINKESKLI